MNPYIADILAQPDALRSAVKAFDASPLDALRQRIQAGEFDRIILTGMGSSHNATYPAWLQLASLPIPVVLLDAAELLHYLGSQIGPRSLLWLNSQSGRSIELIRLLDLVRSAPPASIIATVNDETSPMAQKADIRLPIHAGPESTVSTKTYLNTVAVNLLSALCLCGRPIGAIRGQILAVADAAESYLAGWESRVAELDSLLGQFERLFVLGRGPSMCTVWTGSLICKEAAKYAAEGMHAAEFRHGPLELASRGLAALVVAGPAQTSILNRGLAADIAAHGGGAVWVDSVADGELPSIVHPSCDDLLRPLVEILPLQLLTVLLARRNNVEPGHFRIIGKVTSKE